MRTYDVSFQVRRRGTIFFNWETALGVEAQDAGKAIEKARLLFLQRGFEVSRGPGYMISDRGKVTTNESET